MDPGKGGTRRGGAATVEYLQYPSTLGSDIMHWINFKAFDVKSGGDPTLDIALYIPGDALQTSYKADWEAVSMGKMLGMADKAADLSQIPAGTFSMSGLKTGIAAGLKAGAGESSKVAMLEVAKLGESTIPGSKAWMERKAGAVLNPFIVAAYKGPSDMRTHDFTFQMLPQSEMESRNCMRIANAFKKSMLPAHKGGQAAAAPSMLFGYPDTFEISYTINGDPLPKSDSNPMFNIGKSVLTSCDLDFSTESTTLFFDDTQYPVSISMKLSFMETEVMYRERIKEGA